MIPREILIVKCSFDSYGARKGKPIYFQQHRQRFQHRNSAQQEELDEEETVTNLSQVIARPIRYLIDC